MTYETILTETRGRVGWITVNRPEVLNALNTEVMREIVAAASAFDADDAIGAIVLTGSEKAFAAGADIAEMSEKSGQEMIMGDHFGEWARFAEVRTPVIAAVSGYALGGGCELAMMCDIILAADTAKFGQPEIKLGVIPGMGGSQRLTRAIGKSKAMELNLTGRMMGAEEAERANLVSRVVPAADLLDEAFKLAEQIAAMPPLAIIANKEAVAMAFEATLATGLAYERRLFNGLCATDDKREGMSAFVAKRAGEWKGR